MGPAYGPVGQVEEAKHGGEGHQEHRVDVRKLVPRLPRAAPCRSLGLLDSARKKFCCVVYFGTLAMLAKQSKCFNVIVPL